MVDIGLQRRVPEKTMLLVTLANSECEMHCAVGFFDHREKLKLTQLSETPNRSQNLLSSTKLYTSSVPEPQPACGLARLPPNKSFPSDESLEPLQASSRPTQQISAWLFDCHPQHHPQSSSKHPGLLQAWPQPKQGCLATCRRRKPKSLSEENAKEGSVSTVQIIYD